MTSQRRQPKGVPVGGQFATNEHDEAPSLLSRTPETVRASDIRPGDIVVTQRWNGRRDITEHNVVTKVEPVFDLSSVRKVRVSFEGDEDRELGEGARVSAASSPMTVIRSGDEPAPRTRSRSVLDLKVALKAAALRTERGEEVDVDAAVSAALDPSANDEVSARAKRLADAWEARNWSEGATRLRAAAERIRLASDPNARVDDYYSLAASPDTPPKLVEKAADEGFTRGNAATTAIAISNNPNAPRSTVILALAACDEGGERLDWVAEKLRPRL